MIRFNFKDTIMIWIKQQMIRVSLIRFPIDRLAFPFNPDKGIRLIF